jgi:hypothetical protein
MLYFLTLMFLLIAAALGAVWIWLLLGLLKSGKRWIYGALALQLSLIITFIVLAMGGGWSAVIGFIWPLPTAVLTSDLLLQHSNFYADFYYLPLGAGLCLALIAAIFAPLRIWTPLIVVAVAIPLALPMAERHSRSLMCQRALALGASEVKRHRFLWSLRYIRTNFLGEAHGLTIANGQTYIWSYKRLDWSPVDTQPYAQPGYIQTACGKA